MENNDLVYRSDGSVIAGLTGSEWEEYLKSYGHVPIAELIHTRDFCGDLFGLRFIKRNFEACATSLLAQKENEDKYGKCASLVTSLFMLLSVRVRPRKSSSLTVYGEIKSVSGCYPDQYVYERKSRDAERLLGSDDGGYLTLSGPSGLCFPYHVGFLLQSRKLSIRLYDRPGDHLLVDDYRIILDYSGDDFEQVKDEVVQNTEISLALKYVSIPMAVYELLSITILKREENNLPNFLNVCGKVIAKYKNTFGNYKSEEIVVFDKKPEFNQFEEVNLEMENNLLSSSRCWVAVPVYSLLQLHIDLFDSARNPILTEDLELGGGLETGKSSKEFVSRNYYISVSASRCIPPTQPPEQDGRDDQIFRSLEPCTPQPRSSVEVFSVLVCYEECTPLQIHGHIQFSCNWTMDFNEMGVDIFKREKEYPLTLLGRSDTIPVLNGSRVLDRFLPFSMICDLKDIRGCLNIKGYQIFDELHCSKGQLCSVFRGDHGFAALHYTIFSSAVQANLKVFVYQQKRSQCVVFGSICARYKDFDYSSQYNKNCYRIVLFKGREVLVQMDADGSSIPLSRTSFVVPSYSSSMLDLDLMIGTQKFSCELNFVIGTPTISTKEGECEIEFVFEWSEVQ